MKSCRHGGGGRRDRPTCHRPDDDDGVDDPRATVLALLLMSSVLELLGLGGGGVAPTLPSGPSTSLKSHGLGLLCSPYFR